MAFLATALDALARKTDMNAADLARLQAAIDFAGPLTEPDLAGLFALERAAVTKPAGWKRLFVATICDHVLDDIAPAGYLTAAKADRLLELAAPEGRFATLDTFGLLLSLATAARFVPERLISALYDEVYRAVLTGLSPLRELSPAPAGTITRTDCDIVHHLLQIGGASGYGAVTKAEAVAILAIDQANDAQPCPEWIDLFCRAMGDAAMAAAGRVGPPREQALARADGQPAPEPDALAAHFATYRPMNREERAIAALERQRITIITADEVSAVTIEWLDAALSLPKRASPAARILLEALSIVAENASERPLSANGHRAA